MNEQNLIPNSQRTPSERRELARKAGIASGKARLRKKHGRELAQAMLSLREQDPNVVAELAKSYGIDEAQVTKDVAMNGRQIDKAIRKADTKAYLAVNKVAGFLDPQDGEGATLNIVVSSEAGAAAAKWSKQ